VPVIPVAISKGGAGKTTVTVNVACELCRRGATVTIIDTDPRQHVVDWALLPNAPPNLKVIGRPDWREKSKSNRAVKLPTHVRLDATQEDLMDLIEQAAADTAFVLVDLEGTANLMASYAVTMADLVIIPVQGSQLDAKEAAAVIGLVRTQSRVANREIPYVIALSKTNPAVVFGTQKYVETTLREGHIPVMATQLADREPFRSIFSYGGGIAALADKMTSKSQRDSLQKAQQNLTHFTNEILMWLKETRTKAETLNDGAEAAPASSGEAAA
jgi:chromosome partitioning protein